MTDYLDTNQLRARVTTIDELRSRCCAAALVAAASDPTLLVCMQCRSPVCDSVTPVEGVFRPTEVDYSSVPRLLRKLGGIVKIGPSAELTADYLVVEGTTLHVSREVWNDLLATDRSGESLVRCLRRARTKAEAWRLLTPIDMELFCPECGKQHLDVGEFTTRVHRKHLCENTPEGPRTGCGHLWVPFQEPTRGVLRAKRA
jgi:hypothetical protein